jgi:hypothetical protein
LVRRLLTTSSILFSEWVSAVRGAIDGARVVALVPATPIARGEVGGHCEDCREILL